MARGLTGHRPWRVAVIGAGLGGVAVATHLKKLGVDFTVYEKADGPGGVWWHNTYPGCEVDVASIMYSYSFMPYRWSSTHAPQRELQQYVEHVIDHFGIGDHFRFGCGVTQVRWHDETCSYSLTTDDGATEEYQAVISCLGMLSNPRLPDWPGMGSFEGVMFHTARYRHDIDLTGARVAIVGTGCTACQLAPAIAPSVGRLDIYQREPGWVTPKEVGEVPDRLNDRYERHRWLWKLHRHRAFYAAWRNRGVYNSRSRSHAQKREQGLDLLERTVRDPEVRALLTPQYPYGCKRPIFASGYYEVYNRSNVRLVPRAVTGMTPRGLVDDQGVERDADVVILATGFEATRYQGTLQVHGRDGLDLHDVWGSEPRAFLGITVPGFPNFFMLYGPNTNGAMSIISPLERQAEVVARAIRHLRRSPHVVLDTRQRAADRYDAWIQRRMRSRDVETSGCHNYFHSSTGKNVTQLPMTAPMYFVATRVLSRVGWKFDALGPPTRRRLGSPDGFDQAVGFTAPAGTSADAARWPR